MQNKPQILHICPDEKYMDGAIHLFEKAFPTNNLFLVVTLKSNSVFRYIRSENVKFKKLALHKEIISEILEIVDQFQVVVMHALNLLNAEIINSAGKADKFIWVMMGAEVYENALIYKNELYGTKTRGLKEKTENSIDYINLLKEQYRKLRYGNYKSKTNSKQILLAAGKVSCFASLVQEEYEFLSRNKILSGFADFLRFSYYPIEYFADTNNKATVGKAILIGNSSNYTNNHLEVFEMIKVLDIAEKKIYVPLSYGNMNYRKALIPLGEKMLGNQFVPVTEFMSLNKYNELIRSCGIVIMNNYRQQAVGNILAALWQGSKVYLSKKNILYDFFGRIGCKVYSIEKELVPENKEALRLLSDEVANHNREILQIHISEKVLVDSLRKGIKEKFDID